VIVGPGGVLFVELKSAAGRVDPGQRAWLDELAAAGEQVRVWRPEDWRSRVIHGELKALTRRHPGPFSQPVNRAKIGSRMGSEQ
jgi:hypothetical protein